MCLLNPRALQVHGHELHVSPIYGDMKQPHGEHRSEERLGPRRQPRPLYASSYASYVSW